MKPLSLFILISYLFLSACSNKVTSPQNLTDLDDISIYDDNSNYKTTLKACAINKECKSIPFLKEDGASITKDIIMKRVLVSHKWMGDRFSQILDALEPDIKLLLGNVKSIVIDNDIIPSFYASDSSSIYIDARYLWLTQEEAKTITIKEDYRSSFSNKLSFLQVSRYTINGKQIPSYISIESNKTRTVEDVKYYFASLLYHELAHASDFYKQQNISSKLVATYPLQSSILQSLGQVMYQGISPNLIQQNLTAQEVGEEFYKDKASAMYAYSSIYEDTAMLFQLAMLKYHYNIQRDIGFIVPPTKKSDLTCNDYILGWGERNKIADANVKERAIFVTKEIFGDSQDWTNILNKTLGSSVLLKTNINWCESINTSNRQSKSINTSYKLNKRDFKIDQY